MATETPQRAYRALCPACGAPVEFRSAQSTHAVCAFCRSTLVRDGETLARLGKMAELFEDYSPLQLMASGRLGDLAFTLVGRLQYRSTSGTWTEWVALLPDGRTAILGEDNGSYVWSESWTPPIALPEAARLRLGAATAVGGVRYTVTANDEASLVSAQGELPKLPPLNAPFAMVELRSDAGEVLAVDYGERSAPQASRGRAVRLEELRMTGLRDAADKEGEAARQFACPNCGAPVSVLLASSKSVVCPACKSVIDLAEGTPAGEWKHATQDEPVEPLIPLGSTGALQGASWQVVGFQHRMGHEPGDEDESFGWSEYLLYNRERGFLFLVDSTEGWSLAKPVTGAPRHDAGSSEASYLGTRYRLKERYEAETVYVAGEFYWPARRDEKTSNADFESGANLLSMERSPRELVWSAGNRIASDTVAKAFKLQGKAEVMKRADIGPTIAAAGLGGLGFRHLIIIVVVLVLLVVLLRACSDNTGAAGSGYRSGGGSYGGYSSGGGHK